MEQTYIVLTILICITVLLAMILWVFGRIRSEQQKTLQKIIEQNELSQTELQNLLSPMPQYQKDLRRGILLIALGLSLGTVFFFMGGIAWIFTCVPVSAGLIYLLLWRLNVPK